MRSPYRPIRLRLRLHPITRDAFAIPTTTSGKHPTYRPPPPPPTTTTYHQPPPSTTYHHLQHRPPPSALLFGSFCLLFHFPPGYLPAPVYTLQKSTRPRKKKKASPQTFAFVPAKTVSFQMPFGPLWLQFCTLSLPFGSLLALQTPTHNSRTYRP